MFVFDPVPRELLLPPEAAADVLPGKFLREGMATAQSLALQVLVVDNDEMNGQLRWLREGGRQLGGGVEGLFQFMRQSFDAGEGTQVDRVIATACLYPQRHWLLDVVKGGTAYIAANGASEHDLISTRTFLGDLAMNGLLDEEENAALVGAGKIHPSLVV